MKKLISFLTLIFLKSILIKVKKTCNEYNKVYYEKHFDQSLLSRNVTISFFANFKELNDLILDCSQTYDISEYVSMLPKKSLLIDEKFQLKKIINQRKIDSISYFSIGNLNGIDLNSKSFILDSNRLKKKVDVNIYMSKLNIYQNSKLLDSSSCDLVTYNNNNNASTNFLKYFFFIQFQNVNYPEKWCPYFFRNFDLVNLAFSSITNSFLIKNRLNFYELNSTQVYFNFLKILGLSITYDFLDKKSLSSLFRKVEFLGITGVLTGIELHLFKNFTNLKVITLGLSNLREFFHMGNYWMKNLNLKAMFNLGANAKISIRLEFIHLTDHVSFDFIYEYPNEDLCLFKDFPHERAIYPLLVPGKRIECTCTIYWLQHNTYKYKNDLNIIFDYSTMYEHETFRKVFLFCNSTFNSSECQFGIKFEMCSNKEVIREFTHKLSPESDVDILYTIKFIEFILLVILAPIFCFIGIIHNGLTILVIKNRNMKKEFNESMYKHIIINAGFNIVYCLIMALKLINTCIFYGPSIFCSSVYQEIWAQQFKIILVHFLGNAIKMCSNVSYLIFSITRLLLITKQTDTDTNSTIQKNFILIYIILLVVISLFLSSFKLFQYSINQTDQVQLLKEFPFEIRDEQFCNLEENVHESLRKKNAFF